LLGLEWEFPGRRHELKSYSSMNYYRSHIEEFFHVTAPTCQPAPPVRGRCVMHFAAPDVLHVEYEFHNVSASPVEIRARWFSEPEPGLNPVGTAVKNGFRHQCRQKVFTEYETSAVVEGLPFQAADGRWETAWQTFTLEGGARRFWHFHVRFEDAAAPEHPWTVEDAVDRMEKFYGALPSLPAPLEPFEPVVLRAAGIVQSCRYSETAPNGQKMITVHGGKAGVEALWFWDTCITTLGSALVGDAETGWNSYRLLWQGIRDDGHPFYRYLNGEHEAGGQNPILAWGVWNFHTLHPNREALKEAYPALCRYVNWWLEKAGQSSGLCAFARGEGLFIGLDDGLSTMENFPIALAPEELWFEKDWGSKREDLFELPDVNSHLFLEMKALARIAGSLGRQEEAEEWQVRADGLGRLIHERLFNPKAGIYQTRCVKTGRFSELVSAESFLPIFAGVTPGTLARKICRDFLLNPERFYTVLPFPTLDLAHEAFRSGGRLYEPAGWPGSLVQQSYWQGRSWLNYDYFLIGALHQAGLEREAEAAVRKILEAVSRHETLYECYDPLTGTGNGHAEFPWAAGAMLAMTFGLYKEGPLRKDPEVPREGYMEMDRKVDSQKSAMRRAPAKVG